MQIVLGPNQLTGLVDEANGTGLFHRLLIKFDLDANSEPTNVTAYAVKTDYKPITRQDGSELSIPGCPYPPACDDIDKKKGRERDEAIKLCEMAREKQEKENNIM